MKLSLWTFTAALIAAVVLAPAAGGAMSDTAGESETLEGACPFPVLIEGISEHGGTSRVRLTNTVSGASVVVRIAGSFRFSELPNGDGRFVGRGQFLAFYLEGDVGGPGLFHTRGRAVETIDAETGAITTSRVTGRRTDMCAQLS